MKKNLISALFICATSILFSGNVPFNTVELVAKNFIELQSGKSDQTITLANIIKNSNGKPLYYTFNVNYSHGFVLVAADDAAYPIIGYSLEQPFVIPEPNSNIGNWLKKREGEIDFLFKNNIKATENILNTWRNLIVNVSSENKRTSANVVAPLLTTNWSQAPFYNDSCPGGSVTGCVATTMAQIMKYWNYPSKGTGSSSYFSINYGVLKANYGAATYNYANMPNTISASNSEVAKLMYHCGVSVEMDYSPSGSGAVVIAADHSICAENSFKNYFGYNPTTILGSYRSIYTDSNWHTLLQSDLNIGRPIQYAGFGITGGHTWVCDGYDQNNFYHMNWGWGGNGNGYYNIDALNPMGIDFNSTQQAITGIVPKYTNTNDAGVLNIIPSGMICGGSLAKPIIRFRNYGVQNLTSCTISYQIDNQATQSINWNGNLVTGQTATVGTTDLNLSNGAHKITYKTSNPNNLVDMNILNDQLSSHLNLISTDVLPHQEDFETQDSSDHWVGIENSVPTWSVCNFGASSGSKSMMLNNMINVPGNESILEGLNHYDLSSCGQVDFSFKMAYQEKNINGNDVLKLQVSNNCGKNWNTLWTKKGSALATNQLQSNTAFMPTQSDFIEYHAIVPFYNQAIFRFVFIADANAPGNNIYIDQIQIKDLTVGLKEINEEVGLFVYPNPSNEIFHINYSSKTENKVKLEITDITGRLMLSSNIGTVSAGDQKFEVNTSLLPNGVYLLNIHLNESSSVRKIVVQH